MRRVHRSLNAEQVAALRGALSAQLPNSDLPIGEVIRQMRLSIKRSQSEYAQLCGVAPRVLAEIEAGTGNPTQHIARYCCRLRSMSASHAYPMICSSV
ncbi:helix-turn-helix transcriptional regulator [Povalibacter sp.]|uniref:helix-turn-helix domain-containing protein n=1 Tax=Povalibacter sp. TaxID=1962978 RepID=UPI002F40F889